jgi:hypothetical protein
MATEIQTPNHNIEDKLGVIHQQGTGGRRGLKFNIGSMTVSAVEIPADVLTDEERGVIEVARGSYLSMWGGNSFKQVVERDKFDGGPGTAYNTYHYIARVSAPGEEDKIITKRKVYLDQTRYQTEFPKASLESLIPDDIAFWVVQDRAKAQRDSLWHTLKNYFEQKGIPVDAINDPRLKIPANSRTATYPYEVGSRDQRQKEKTPIGFSAIELLLADNPEDYFIACQLCPEFRDKVLTVVDKNSQIVGLDFPKTETALNLPLNKSLSLNNRDKYVLKHKLKFPGYWINNEGAAAVMINLASAGKLGIKDLYPVLTQLYSDPIDEAGRDKLTRDLLSVGLTNVRKPELFFLRQYNSEKERSEPLPKLIKFLTSSRYFKYFVHTLSQRTPINESLTSNELRYRLIYEAGDGPFSSFLTPSDWLASNLNLLLAAKDKYEA